MNAVRERWKCNTLVLILGDNLEYSATQVFIKALKRLGIDVVSLETGQIRTSSLLWEVPRRCFGILADHKPNLIVVSNMSHRIVPVARRIAGRVHAPLWFLPLISQYETAVFDRKTAKKVSMKAFKAFFLDWYSCRAADRILFDTEEHLHYFEKNFGKMSKASVVPIGVDDDIFRWHPFDKSRTVTKVLFYGGFSPLHGVDMMVRAAAFLPKDQFDFTFLGDGPEKSKCEMLAYSLRITNACFLPRVPYIQLPRIIAAHDIGLGIFGNVAKVDRVIPNKVLQTLAVGRPVITRRTDPVQKAFKGDNGIVLVQASSSEIAAALQLLIEDRSAMERLGFAASNYTRQAFGIGAVAECIRELVKEDLGVCLESGP